MLIDVVRPETWDELNERVHQLLNLQPKERARCFKGLGAAVFEVTRGTAQFLTHKKSIGFVLGQTPVFAPLLPAFYKETYEISTVSHLDLKNVNEWVDNLKKDTNFIVFSEDHPVTGQLYNFVDELDQLLNSKRIFSFRISHRNHFFQKMEARPYTVRFCSYGPEVAVAICGERFRSPTLVAREESWDAELFCQKLQDSQLDVFQNPSAVKEFESQAASWSQTFFADSVNRIWDRAVLVFPEVSAEAVAQVFFKKFGGEKWKYLETPNMCRWSTTDLFQKWWQPAVSLETLRGMLLVDQALLQNKDFANQLHSAYDEVKAEQSWDV